MPPQPLVLDAFPLLALFLNEVAAGQVEQLLEQSRGGEAELSITAVNLGEVAYRVQRKLGPGRAREAIAFVSQSEISVVEISRELALAAAGIKAVTGMGYLDCFPVALAQRLDAAVVTGDPGFAAVEERVEIIWLPQVPR